MEESFCAAPVKWVLKVKKTRSETGKEEKNTVATYNTRKKKNHTRLTIKGAATVESIGKLADAFRRTISRSDRIVVDTSRVTEADISFYQLLCSAHCTSFVQGKSLEVEHSDECTTIREARRLGFDLVKGCGAEAMEQCLWNREHRENTTLEGRTDG
jgi:ABC-type transporter Mla MlaB component